MEIFSLRIFKQAGLLSFVEWSLPWNCNYFFPLVDVLRWTVTAIHSLVWRMPGSFVFRYRYSLLVLQLSTLMIILWEGFLPITLSSSRYEYSISLVQPTQRWGGWGVVRHRCATLWYARIFANQSWFALFTGLFFVVVSLSLSFYFNVHF